MTYLDKQVNVEVSAPCVFLVRILFSSVFDQINSLKMLNYIPDEMILFQIILDLKLTKIRPQNIPFLVSIYK